MTISRTARKTRKAEAAARAARAEARRQAIAAEVNAKLRLHEAA